MAKNSTAKKLSITPGIISGFHPELIEEVKRSVAAKQKSPPYKKTKKRLAGKQVQAKPFKKSNRIKLVSAKEAESVIDQMRVAFSVSAIGCMVGVLLGAAIPLTTFMIAHYELKEIVSVYTLLVIGGLIFSANSVFSWTKSAFRSSVKALGFVVIIEGAMIFSKIGWVGYLGLGILIAINAVASGANLVIKPQKKPSWEV